MLLECLCGQSQSAFNCSPVVCITLAFFGIARKIANMAGDRKLMLLSVGATSARKTDEKSLQLTKPIFAANIEIQIESANMRKTSEVD